MTIHGVDTLVLFDPHVAFPAVVCSHCLWYSFVILVNLIAFRDSGIGDHGPDGIEAFISQHHCNNICHGLKLNSLSLVEEEERDSDVELENADED